MTPHACPVCGGDGTVERYRWLAASMTAPYIETCHACKGSGVIWEGAFSLQEDVSKKKETEKTKAWVVRMDGDRVEVALTNDQPEPSAGGYVAGFVTWDYEISYPQALALFGSLKVGFPQKFGLIAKRLSPWAC